MARKPKKSQGVSLAPVPSLTLKGDNAPTPERLMQAGVSVSMRIKDRTYQIVGPKKSRPVGDDGVFRLSEAPLDRLCARGRLDESDRERNGILFEAGDKLRRHYYYGGLSGIGSVDLNRSGGGSGSPAWLTPTTESAVYHRNRYRDATVAVYPEDWSVVFAVVCEERSLTDSGRDLGYRNDDAASAVALDRLRRGLERLAQHWGYLPGPPPAPVNDNRYVEWRESRERYRKPGC